MGFLSTKWLDLGAYAQEEVFGPLKIKIASMMRSPILNPWEERQYLQSVLGEYSVSATFNVYDLSLFDVGDDSRLNLS